MNQDKIDRINTLYHKSQSVGLTEEEKEEQKIAPQRIYRSNPRNMRGTLNNISIKEKDGTITDLDKKYGNISDIQS